MLSLCSTCTLCLVSSLLQAAIGASAQGSYTTKREVDTLVRSHTHRHTHNASIDATQALNRAFSCSSIELGI